MGPDKKIRPPLIESNNKNIAVLPERCIYNKSIEYIKREEIYHDF